MTLPASFYVKLSAACFVLGGCMELFMIKTGFYTIVTNKEAERYVENRENRERLQQEIREQLRAKGIDLDLPPPAGK